MNCNNISFQELFDCFEDDFENNLEVKAWDLEHDPEKM